MQGLLPMATINIARAHALPKDEARKRAEQIAATMREEFGLAWHWEGDALHFAGEGGAAKGTTGQVRVGDAEVRVVIDLPFMLGVLRGKIERKVAESLKAAL
jgi:putative polyhydroxyalkanoate system protein